MRLYFLVVAIAVTSACSSTRKTPVVDFKIQKVIATARTYTGTPYRWGGTTKRGMDCSGLLCVSYQSAGLELPRTSAAQSKTGRQIKINELKPGDLVFFSAKRGRGKITHVGMVTAVKNSKDVRFIHSSTKLGVVENNLHSKYYRSIFVKARRPF